MYKLILNLNHCDGGRLAMVLVKVYLEYCVLVLINILPIAQDGIYLVTHILYHPCGSIHLEIISSHTYLQAFCQDASDLNC